eukprot:scaffold2281_cov215-Alexandrium_tamarense.AAC.12
MKDRFNDARSNLYPREMMDVDTRSHATKRDGGPLMRDGDGQNRDLNVVDASRYQKTNLLLLGICKSEPPPWWWCSGANWSLNYDGHLVRK